MAKLPKSATLFEASWEICNKAGGIHTVLTSKLAYAQEHFSERYLPVGPFLGEQQNAVFREEAIPDGFKALSERAAQRGITVHYGRWLIDGEPPIFLLGWDGLVGRLNEAKAHYWDKYQLDTLGTVFYDVDQPLLWSMAVGEFVACFAELNAEPVILHAHEWLSAGAFLALGDHDLPNLKTIFTTHATVLGRALSSSKVFIYDKFATLNPDQEARNHGVTTKHQLECLAATLATIFTTVSHITAEEATAFLGRKPEVIVENGLNAEAFPSFDQLSQKHSAMREQLHDFTSAYFFPSYRFDLSNTHYQFTMGRYEIHNKGYDLYLRSLSELNKELKEKNSPHTVISLFLVPGDALQLRKEVTKQITIYRQVRQVLSQYIPAQQQDLYEALWKGRSAIDEFSLIPDAVRKQLHLLLAQLPTSTHPAISPFQLRQGDNDGLIQVARQYGLENNAEDRVKVLFFPIYFDGFDGVFDQPLYDIISGCDHGIFPSYYEPWGYTPMESLGMGIPAVTSTLAGFGRALENKSVAGLPDAAYVLDRNSNNEDAEAAALTKVLRESLEEEKRQWLLRRISSYLLIQAFDWSILYKNYLDAYQQALSS